MSVKYTSYETGDDSYSGFYGAVWQAMIFTPLTTHTTEYVVLKVYRLGTPGDATISIRAVSAGKPTGSDLCSVTVDTSAIGTGTLGEWTTFTFSSTYSLTKNTLYAIVCRCPSGTAANTIRWREDATTTAYPNGGRCSSTDSGATWTGTYTQGGEFMFQEWGTYSPPINKIYSRKLIAIGGNEVWYESTAGTMSELSAANNDINCSSPLEAIEAYQKIFIVNKDKLKVIDFINTKINTSDAGLNPCTPGMTLAGGTSTASMIVDYVDGVTDNAAANIYGYRTSVATFSSGETVTGTNSAGNTVSFVLSAAETAPTTPHWYNWTVFGNDTTNYGTMPSSSSLIALYRGRVIINNSNLPHAWAMFKVGNPFKCKYDTTNDGDLSAVTHTNTKVGEIGDIITAFIPYKDDLFIFGCANSIWILIGDPLSEGQLAKVTGTTGIWGSRSWCIDDKSNLYFLGDDGIYTMPISESYSPPQNISRLALPNLIVDLDLDKNLHRITFRYDPIKNGILISKTLLSDGTNTNYWFDLNLQGFYPESYPTSCGIFSAYYYPATDDTYKKFLIGCNDGYIREFDNLTKNDATTSSTSAIDSYYATVQQLAEDEDTEGKLTWLNGITAGGASGGDFTDTDSVGYSLFEADDAETCLEDIKDNATAFSTGTWSGTGKQTKNRIRMRGYWMGIKLRNNTASETWAIDKTYMNIEKVGRD